MSVHSPLHSAVAPLRGEKIPLSKKLAWGAGSVTGNLALNSINALATPIYNVGIGLDAAMLGIAMSVPRFVDAVLDPVIGVISDNTKSRFGRRRPFMLTGALLLGVLGMALWAPPLHSSKNLIFFYFTIVSMLFYVSFSIFQIPWTAMGYELSLDYDERTRIMAVATYLGLALGLVIPWLYKLTLLDVFGRNELVGVRWVGGGVALLMLVTGLIPVFSLRERKEFQAEEPFGLRRAVVETFKNRSFRILAIVTVVALASTFMVSPALLYINIYSLYHGDKAAAASLGGWAGMVQLISAVCGVPLHTWVSTHWGKRHAAMVAVSLTIVGFIAYWWLLNPAAPYLQLIYNFFVGFGIQGLWLLSSSMLADVCDEDELHTGRRREGVYGSAMAFGQKAGLALAALLSGLIIRFAGMKEGVTPTAAALFNLKLLFVVLQISGMGVCLVLLAQYSLTRARMEEIRRHLDARRGNLAF